MDKRIVKFIKKHHVLTLATSKENSPWCANCFYVYLENENWLIFTSDHDTRHIQDTFQQSVVAGSIVLETNVIGKIRGIQFAGKIFEPTAEQNGKVKKAYLTRFPVAMLMETTLWIVELTYIKMPDNRLGFGKKLIWDKKEPEGKE